jgi:hypothetical protein
MPKKSMKNKIPRRKRVQKRRKGGVRGQGPYFLSFHPKGFELPIPRRFQTSFVVEADYKVPIATASLWNGAVKLNSLWLPFRPGGATAFSAATFLGPATEATLLPTGFSQICTNSLYNNIKTLKSTISVRLQPTTGSGATSCVVFPQFNTLSVSDIYHARTLPYSKQAIFNSLKANVGTNRSGWLTNSIDPEQYIGYDHLEGKADIIANVSGVTADPSVTMWWGIFFQTSDLDVTATVNTLLQIRVKYDVELYAPDFGSVT